MRISCFWLVNGKCINSLQSAKEVIDCNTEVAMETQGKPSSVQYIINKKSYGLVQAFWNLWLLDVFKVLKLHSLFETFKKHHSWTRAHESRNALAFLRFPKLIHKTIILYLLNQSKTDHHQLHLLHPNLDNLKLISAKTIMNKPLHFKEITISKLISERQKILTSWQKNYTIAALISLSVWY